MLLIFILIMVLLHVTEFLTHGYRLLPLAAAETGFHRVLKGSKRYPLAVRSHFWNFIRELHFSPCMNHAAWYISWNLILKSPDDRTIRPFPVLYIEIWYWYSALISFVEKTLTKWEFVTDNQIFVSNLKFHKIKHFWDPRCVLNVTELWRD